MKTKTSELAGAALDWAVAKCEGLTIDCFGKYGVSAWSKCSLSGEDEVVIHYAPSILWIQAGPIINREGISTVRLDDDFEVDAKGYCTNKRVPVWAATLGQHSLYDDCGQTSLYVDDMVEGPTPLTAAMRRYVASKLGGEIDVPEELLCSNQS